MTSETHTEFKDWLAEVITDSLDVDWTPRDAANLIVERLGEQPVYDAAHDLLEALDGAVKLIESGDPYAPLCCGGGADCACRGSSHADLFLHDTRAAIAKAEGRS